MPEYRFYKVSTSGHIKGPPTDHDAPDDLAAIRRARQLLDGGDVEIWQGTRVVAYVTTDEKLPLPSG